MNDELAQNLIDQLALLLQEARTQSELLRRMNERIDSIAPGAGQGGN
jgi:hypothetical protein